MRLLLRWLSGARVDSPPQQRRPHPKNVPGPFYVEDGCCLACGVWEIDAAPHFAWEDEPVPHCFVSRQPETDAEARNMAEAISKQEVDCIRFRGPNSAWRQMLRDAGLKEFIDPD